ncbi:diacylglycerol O-acyltransferase 2-like isoform X3 [Amblyomma americanum]
MPSTAAPFRPEQKGMRFVGMEWAPLQLPLHRRLETLAAVYFTFSFLAQGIVGWLLLLYVLLCTRLYPLSLLYAAWLYWDRNTCDRGGRRSDWARRWTIWKYFRDYFPIRLVKTCELPADRNYLLGCHPHGIMCAGAFCNFATEGTDFSGTFPGIWPHLLVLRGQFALPLHRELMLMGGMCSATQESLDWILSREPCGNAAVLVVGGAIEALEARPGRHRLFLSRRKGFVRTALRHGGKTARRPQERESQRRGGRPRAPAVRRRTGAALQRAQEPLRGAGSRAHHHLKPGKTAQRVRRVSAPRCLHSRTKDDDSGGVLDYPRPDIPRKWCTGHGSD